MSKPKKADKFYTVATHFINEENLIFFKGTPYLFNEGIWREEDKENTLAWIGKQYIKAFAFIIPSSNGKHSALRERSTRL